MKKIVLLTLLTGLFLSACQPKSLETKSQEIQSAEPSQTKPNIRTSVGKEFMISSEGIGRAKLGMTLGKLKQISDHKTEFKLISPFMVDVNAIAVSQGSIVQYYILYPAGTTSHPDRVTPTDEDLITTLMTDNFNYQTKEGVKVGTRIEEAEKIYGNATLSYNVENESREYITFSNYMPPNMRFRASYFKSSSNGLSFSGIYPEYPQVSYKTDKYREDAVIAAIEVSCPSDNCVPR
ncbi:hypothetical protein [Pleurocapsa sp. PCC 7319]|uniref:hypothetical protein n=1 Tax=Pleurocapsa sp. PCC 7319 TaxID=118161 RepID=UPI000347BA8E|nr:hypothetical protein [Pleurocapsa sp. PCC 7319]